MSNSQLLSALARSFLAAETTVEQIVARASQALGRSWRWLKPLARRYVATVAGQTRPRRREVVQFLAKDPGFARAWSRHFDKLSVETWLTEPNQMQPVTPAQAWDIPIIETAGDLAAWLLLSVGDLEWFADLKALGYKKRGSRLRHYHYRILAKQYGSIRLIEAPKPRLKALQRRILSEILDKIPPHSASHGFVQGRSIKTFIAPHVGRRVVLRMDLREFFPSFLDARIQTLFRTIGYPESVADLLGGICTNAVPREIWKSLVGEIDPKELQEARLLYSRPHLPQGAPTSPALANICAYRIDCRLTGLARSARAEYTRYADDLAFSGGVAFERHVERFSTHVASILLEEGFSVNPRKTRIMRQGVRQQLVGLVANQRVNVMRRDFDRLKATLTNCVRISPDSQNRESHPEFRAHLEGRIAFVESVNPDKAKRLRAIFDRIQWQ